MEERKETRGGIERSIPCWPFVSQKERREGRGLRSTCRAGPHCPPQASIVFVA